MRPWATVMRLRMRIQRLWAVMYIFFLSLCVFACISVCMLAGNPPAQAGGFRLYMSLYGRMSSLQQAEFPYICLWAYIYAYELIWQNVFSQAGGVLLQMLECLSIFPCASSIWGLKLLVYEAFSWTRRSYRCQNVSLYFCVYAGVNSAKPFVSMYS